MTFVRNPAANRPGTPAYMPKHARTGLNFLLRLNRRRRASFRVERAHGYLREQFRLYYEQYVYHHPLTPAEIKSIDRVSLAAARWLQNHDYLRSLGVVTRHGRRLKVRIFQVVVHPYRKSRRGYMEVPSRQKPRKKSKRHNHQASIVSPVGAYRPPRVTPIAKRQPSNQSKSTPKRVALRPAKKRPRSKHLPPRLLNYIISQAPPWVIRAIKSHSGRKRSPKRIYIGLQF